MDDYDRTDLDIVGFDAPVPHEYWRAGSDTLLVMLPGLGYTNQMPLMFYTQELAMRRRWDILQVNYDYRGMHGTTQEERMVRLAADCRAALDAALADGDRRRVVLAGKSLGTIAITTLLQGSSDRDVVPIWLTPVSNWPEVREAITATAGRSAVVIGTRDDHYDAAFLSEMEERGATVTVVEGGDHSLDIEGDIDASIGALRDVIRSLDGFLGRS